MSGFDPDASGMTVVGWFHRLDVMIDTSEIFKNKMWDTRRLYGLVVGLLAGRASEWRSGERTHV